MFGAPGGGFTGSIKAATEPSSVRFATPWNGWAGRGSTLRSHSALAATDPVICVATANTVAVTHVIALAIIIFRDKKPRTLVRHSLNEHICINQINDIDH